MNFQNRCDCQFCSEGKTTEAHKDMTHDQRFLSEITFNDISFTLTGGSTKCARVMCKYFNDYINQVRKEQQISTNKFEKSKVLELGSGTGLVGLFLSKIGLASVHFTDQQPVLSVTQMNIENNLTESEQENTCLSVLQWGEEPDSVEFFKVKITEKNEKQTKEIKTYDYIVGADLIYAKENINPLISSMVRFSSLHTEIYLSVIRRFSWEDSFFQLMKKYFNMKKIFEHEDIQIFKFIKLINP